MRLQVTDVRFQFAPIELMKMAHSIFHRRLIGTDFAPSLRDQRPTARIHPFGNLVVFLGGLVIGRLFRFDKLALEQCDLFRIVELDHVEGAVDCLRNQRADDEDVRIPLDHHVRIIREPDCAMRRLSAFAISVASIAVVGALATSVGGGAAPPGAAIDAGASGTSPIRHVIVLYQENHTFDNVLGSWCATTHRCDGATHGVLPDGSVIPLATAPDPVPNVKHDTVSQRRGVDGGRMDYIGH